MLVIAQNFKVTIMLKGQRKANEGSQRGLLESMCGLSKPLVRAEV